MIWTKAMTMGVCAGLLASCSAYKPVLKTDGEEMLEIYRNALGTHAQVDDARAALAQEERRAGEGGKKAKPSKKSKRRDFKTRKLDGPDAAKNQYVMGPNGVLLRFQCGFGGRIQDKPCGSGYGFPKLIERQQKRKMKGAGLVPPSAPELEAMARVDDYAKRSTHKGGARKEMPASVPAPKQKETLYENFTATPDNALKQLFPRLPNPDIVVYVTPHLATHNRVPVPGYTTAFPLYDQVHYAMPGEVVKRD